MTHGRVNHCLLFAIYKEMMDKLSLIDVASNEFGFGSIRVLAFSATFIKMSCVLKFVLLSYNKHQQVR